MKDIARKIVKKLPVYKIITAPAKKSLSIVFAKTGLNVDIGGQGRFRMAPEFWFRGFEHFGNQHNSGFAQCIDACRGKMYFIDVGAHVGLYSLPASKVLRTGGKVYAFEPSESNYGYLKQHIGFNGIENIDVHMMAVGDANRDSVEFYEHDIGDSPFGGLVMNKKKAPETYTLKNRQLVCLDEFCKDNGFIPDVIKIDVEGSELQVLKGAQNILEKSNPSIFLSVHPSHLEEMGQSVKDIEDFLKETGYLVLTAESQKSSKLVSGEYICIKME